MIVESGDFMGTAAKYKPNVEIVPDAESVARRSVDVFLSDAQRAISARDVFYVAVSGGHTPKRFFELLGEIPEVASLPWEKIQLFWVDERYVPPDSEWSNYRLAAETFLDKVAIPQPNVHRIPTEYDDFKVAAKSYEQTIRTVFGISHDRLPTFDLIVLGMGIDGHIGSLFPDCYVSFDTADLASVVYVMGDRHDRITLTHPVMCAASHLAVLVCGSEKADILKRVFSTDPEDIRYPAHVLWPVLDKVTWLLDQDAAQSI
jgi:6-phosphogluconolactonase